MFQSNLNHTDPRFWTELETSIEALIVGEISKTANQANFSSLLFHSLPNLNWCGFYLWDDFSNELVLGPFQGKPACIRIRSGQGVCGTAFAQREYVLVEDVHQFPGHIACDEASQSELVIPLLKTQENKVICVGVLDLDAPTKGRFTKLEAENLQRICHRFIDHLI